MRTEPGAHTVELKIPPVALVIMAAVLIWLGAGYFPRFSFQFPYQSILGWTIGVLRLIGCTLGLIEFRRAKTTVNPTKPGASSSLVKTGIYRHTRNPMYLGFLLMLAGWATWNANVISFSVLPGFAFYLNWFQIKPEERALRLNFADEFRAYRSSVRRWI